MAELIYPCSYCGKNVISDAIECSLCMLWCHRSCAKLSKKQLEILSKDNDYWYCKSCKSVFPFYTVDEDEFAYIHTDIDGTAEFIDLYNKCRYIDINQNLYTEHNVCDFEDKIDPNNNFFANIESECSYYTASEFNNKMKPGQNLSLIHFNCRSIKANFENMNYFLESLDVKFDIIAVSETWLRDSDNISDYSIENYEIVNINRNLKRGGGVMLYISKHFEYEKVDDFSFVIDELFEVITVEIKIKNAKNIIVSCLYRTPGGCLDELNNKLSELVNSIKGTKSYLLCGDFNINMINYKNHVGTRNFADILFNVGLFPLIHLPTRISAGNSTLIDNIYSTITHNSSNGVLVEETISDHLPIYTRTDYKGIDKKC